MSFEVPTDQINEAQIGFREDAGISSFDPQDPSLPSIPTVEASIAGLDLSPPYLRCNHCEGRLLRGLQSSICIYCGHYQKKDLPPEPITFHSTASYRLLLDSLNLNESERVEPLAMVRGRNRGQSPAEDEITLSELLDLQIEWRDRSDKPETSFDNRNSLNFGTVDLDNFFTGSKRDIVSDASRVTNRVAMNDDDSFDKWNTFTSSSGSQDTSKQSSNESTAAREKKSELSLFPSTTTD